MSISPQAYKTTYNFEEELIKLFKLSVVRIEYADDELPFQSKRC